MEYIDIFALHDIIYKINYVRKEVVWLSNKKDYKNNNDYNTEATIVINTPYDDAFRTMIQDCQKLLIPLINLVFKKHYSSEAEIDLHHNEYFIQIKGVAEKKNITDSFFTIDGDTYIFECQSTADDTMIVRIFEYAFFRTLQTAVIVSNDTLKTTFPHMAVLYLRSDKNIPDQMKHIISFPEGDFVTHAEIIKIKDYSLADFFEKKLYFLLPFLVFNHENKLAKYNTDPEQLEDLKREYQKMLYQLEQARVAGEIRQIDVNTIMTMAKQVLDNLALKYDNVKKGVDSIMGGKVLEYEGKTIFQEGINEANTRVAKDMLVESFPLAMIAKISKLSEEVITGLANSIGVAVVR